MMEDLRRPTHPRLAIDDQTGLILPSLPWTAGAIAQWLLAIKSLYTAFAARVQHREPLQNCIGTLTAIVATRCVETNRLQRSRQSGAQIGDLRIEPRNECLDLITIKSTQQTLDQRIPRARHPRNPCVRPSACQILKMPINNNRSKFRPSPTVAGNCQFVGLGGSRNPRGIIKSSRGGWLA